MWGIVFATDLVNHLHRKYYERYRFKNYKSGKL